MMTATCPAWCVRDHDTGRSRQHESGSASAEAVSVVPVLNETSGTRRVFIAASGGLGGLALLPPEDAIGLSAILAGLGHLALAALITRTAEIAGEKP